MDQKEPKPSRLGSTTVSIKVLDLFILFGLGIFIGVALCIARLIPSMFPIAAYFGFLSLFHALEYLITALYQPGKVNYECTSVSLH